MKLSDYVAEFIESLGVEYVFAIQGGASAHLIDSVAKREKLQYICNQHEQASAMSADGYARATGNMGIAIATSGPGATNLLTGCCSAYYDSIPMLFLTGQVASFRLKGDFGIRQLGFQETDTVDIFRTVTKSAVLLKNPEEIRYELEKAVYVANLGRKGPVLLDIPDDFQRMDIHKESLKGFECEEKKEKIKFSPKKVMDMICSSQRPIIIAGWGVRLSAAEEEFKKFAERLQIPILCTWGAGDLIEEENSLKVGSFGINGTRYGNFAVQNADFLLILGSRLDTHIAGTPLKNFARAAKKIIVDVDVNELNKYKKLDFPVEMEICGEIIDFLRIMNDNMLSYREENRFTEWKAQIKHWKKKFPICLPEYYLEKKVNPYVFMKHLSDILHEDDMIFADTGCSLVWFCQSFAFKKGQRMFSSFNNTPMGYSLAGSIGAALAKKNRIICISGDGGLQMNIQELATVVRHNLNILILLFENQGYGMIQRTQDMWFGSRYVASDVDSGLAFPNFELIFRDYGFQTCVIEKNSQIQEGLNSILQQNGPRCCIVKVPLAQKMLPQLKAGRPLEDMEPTLEITSLNEEMVIELLK